LPYILRHTQLLPRHFLMLLNSIFAGASVGTQSLYSFPVSEKRVTEGVRRVESRIVEEIFDAFGRIHRTAGKTCRKCLPSLPESEKQGQEQIGNPMKSAVETTGTQHFRNTAFLKQESTCLGKVASKKQYGNDGGCHHFRITHLTLAIFVMMQGLEHVITETKYYYNLGIHEVLLLVVGIPQLY